MDKLFTADTTPPDAAGDGRQTQQKGFAKRIKAVAVLTLLGTPSYVLCSTHICMCGHMEHGPYPRYHWASDIWWMLCFACVLVLSFNLRARGHRLFFYGSLCLMLLVVAGGPIITWPVLLFMDSLAIAYLLMPRIFSTLAKPPVASAREA